MLSQPPNPTDRSCSSAPCSLPLPTCGSVPCARLSLRSKFRAQPQGLCTAVGKLRFLGNLQCPKALLQYCGNMSLLQCCGNAHSVLQQWPHCSNIAATRYCSNTVATQPQLQCCSNIAAMAIARYCYNIVAIGGIAAIPFGIAATPQYFPDEQHVDLRIPLGCGVFTVFVNV